jgi:hypothetical protein
MRYEGCEPVFEDTAKSRIQHRHRDIPFDFLGLI